MKHVLIMLLFLLTVPGSSGMAQEDDGAPVQKLALVIGISNYDGDAKLPGAIEDAKKISASLGNLGFDVTEIENVNDRNKFLEEQFEAFRNKIKPGAFIVFYFSGHGFTYDGESYLVPLNFPVPIPADDVFKTFLSASAILGKLAENDPAVVVMFLDACRDFPSFVDQQSATNPRMHRGLSTLSADTNTVISYAAGEGMVSTGSAVAGLSSYTAALNDGLLDEDLEFDALQKQVLAKVKADTNGKQKPWIASSSTLNIYFNPSSQMIDRFKQAWERVKGVNDPAALQSYLDIFGLGPYAAAARRSMASLDGRASTFTQFSPSQVDAAWAEAKNGPTIIPRITGPFGFPRISTSIQAIQVPTGDTTNFSIQKHPGAIAEVLKNTQKTVVLQEVRTRLAPNDNAGSGVTLGVGSQIAVSNFEYADDGKIWLKASSTESPREFYIPVPPQAGIKNVALGEALSEFVLAQTSEIDATDANEAQISAELEKLQAAGRQIKWVSVSAPRKAADLTVAQKKQAALVDLQAVSAYAFIGKRVPPGKVTLLLDGPASQTGARVRVFGE